MTKQGAYVSRDVVLVGSLAQCLREPFGYAELQGFADLRSPLRQKENCGTKPEDGLQGKAADSQYMSPPLLPSQHPPQVLSEAGECRSNAGRAGVAALRGPTQVLRKEGPRQPFVRRDSHHAGGTSFQTMRCF